MTSLLCACAAPNISPQAYSSGAVGQVNRTVSGKVVSAREIAVSGTTGTGSNSGAAIGAVAGSSLGSNGRDNLAGAIAGAVIGGIAGASVEANATKQIGMEYVIETSNGSLITIAQGKEPLFNQGDKVLILYGSPSRVIADPRN